MTRTKLLFPAILALWPAICLSQPAFNLNNISAPVQKIAAKIAQVNMVMNSAIGYAGERPEQWNNFEKLEKKASTAELTELCNHPNATVRCYAFWALSHRTDVALFPILLEHMDDTARVETLFGCIGGGDQVGDFFIDVMTPDLIDVDSKKMNLADQQKLDSLLIFRPNKLYAKSAAILKAEPSEVIYIKLKALYLEEHNQIALVALAKYRKEADIDLILHHTDKDSKNGLHITYLAMLEFPHPAYRPLLESELQKTLDKKYYSNEWRNMYKLIASYQDNQSLELLSIPFTGVQHPDIRPYHIEFMYAAIKAYKHPIYDELYWRIWEEEKLIESDIFNYLLSKNPERAYQATKKHLDTSYQKQPESLLTLVSGQLSENALESMLNLVIANDTAFANRIIAQKLATVSVHQIKLYTSKVKQQTVFIEPLFQRLEKEWNAHVYLNLVETLIAFKDDQINQRILATRKTNPKLTEGWGGKALNKLLMEHGIK